MNRAKNDLECQDWACFSKGSSGRVGKAQGGAWWAEYLMQVTQNWKCSISLFGSPGLPGPTECVVYCRDTQLVATPATLRTTGSCSHSAREDSWVSREVGPPPISPSSQPSEKGWLSLVDRRRNGSTERWGHGRGSRLSRGRACMWRQVCLAASSHPWAPGQCRGRATPAQVGSTWKMGSWDESRHPRRKMYVAGAQPFGKLEETEGVEEERGVRASPALAWPPWGCPQVLHCRWWRKGFLLRYKESRFIITLSLECLLSASPCGGIWGLRGEEQESKRGDAGLVTQCLGFILWSRFYNFKTKSQAVNTSV